MAVLLALSLIAVGAAAASRTDGAADGPPRERPPADVPLNHWSYPLLERLQARGIIHLDLSTRPVSRADAAAAVANWTDLGGSSCALSERELWVLSRLEAEFLRGEVDSPAYSTGSDDASFGLGVRAFTQLRYGGEAVELDLWPGSAPGGIAPLRGGRDVGVESEPDDELDASTNLDYELWGGLPGLAGFYADSQILLGGQEGARKVRLTSRIRTWRGIAFLSERAYIKLERPSFSVVAGRRGTAWGHSRWGRLMLSGTAPTFDQISARFRVGPVSFESMHALLEYEALGTETDLDDSESAFLAGHRIVVGGGWGSVGVGEAVVYTSVFPDPIYLNPLMPYYLAQHNERENDNILWLIDGVHHLRPGLTAYWELLIDDLQYERSTDHPDKYGVTVGGAWYGAVGRFDTELTAEYTNVRKWTYTHKLTEYRFAHDGLPIGFELGPDSDRFRLELVFHPAVKWSVGTTYEHARRGEGRIAAPFDPDFDNPEPKFPSGVVESTDRLAVELGYQSLESLSAGLGAAYESIENEENSPGNENDGWEFWIGVEFRI
jgi:hypothetical protein